MFLTPILIITSALALIGGFLTQRRHQQRLQKLRPIPVRSQSTHASKES